MDKMVEDIAMVTISDDSEEEIQMESITTNPSPAVTTNITEAEEKPEKRRK